MSVQLIQQYHTKVERIIRYGGSRNESALRQPFLELLAHYARRRDLEMIAELDYRTQYGTLVYPDGTLKDALRQDWGYWESKDAQDDLEAEIKAKFAKGYPKNNILFEDTQAAILYQSGEEVGRASLRDAEALDGLLRRFVNYETQELRDFREAVEGFAQEVPELALELRAIIEQQMKGNHRFKRAATAFLTLCQEAINPSVEMADVREMIIQHLLTQDIFVTVFDESQFHQENNIALKLGEVVSLFYRGATRRKIHHRILPYYTAIHARASQIHNHHEKQKFLKVLYEHFYKAYNPKAADRLGIVYTPNEIVRFMIEAADYLCFKHFCKTLGDKGVEILDPATGTGTFITELIEYLPESQLAYKYQHEIHCNEVAILPYYIANLNIEYTYQQKMGEYVEFENIVFVDTLDNMGFAYQGKQLDLFGLVDENAERIKRQNEREVSVIIGNPPYNANQKNENENNKNRAYPEIDKRIKATYVKHSTAQKTKVYDMYARFFRWASDCLHKNGIIAFITNNSFIDTRTFDGFRKCLENEFDYAYIVNLGGNIRKLSGKDGIFLNEEHTIFGVSAAIGIAIIFLVRKDKPQKLPSRINYIHPCDIRATRNEKIAYLTSHRLDEIPFEHVTPDKNHNWINLTNNDWDELLPVASKETKYAKKKAGHDAIFKLFSLGVVTNRDEWVYDLNTELLSQKIKFFIEVYNREVDKHFGKIEASKVKDVIDYSIKWTRAVKRDLAKGKKYHYQEGHIRCGLYRPFVKRYLYFAQELNEMQNRQPDIFKGNNLVICFTDSSSEKPFLVLVSNIVPDLHLTGAGCGAQCLPLYRYDDDGNRIENITDWGLAQFRTHYADEKIGKEDLFHYVYAVLHHPAYREKYELNLKRELPRVPFYEDFWQWATWGEQLMTLHLNYESITPYPLIRHDISPEQTRKAYKARLKADKKKNRILLDTYTTLSDVPPVAWEYKLGNRSALEWILDRYKERKPRDPTIREKFNSYRFSDYKEQVIDLLLRVTTVSVETMRIVEAMEEV
jgi:predicted helicase